MLFVVGGNRGNAGAAAIQRECERCGVRAAVVGVPKSIDNDILLVSERYESGLAEFLASQEQQLKGVRWTCMGNVCSGIRLALQHEPVPDGNGVTMLQELCCGARAGKYTYLVSMCRLTSALGLIQLWRRPRRHYWQPKWRHPAPIGGPVPRPLLLMLHNAIRDAMRLMSRPKAPQ
jgi:hypothetical protein